MLSVQNPYNLLNRTYEVGLAEMSVREKAGLLSILSFSLWLSYLENIEIIKCQKVQELNVMVNFGLDIINHNSSKAVDAYYEIAKKHGLRFSSNVFKIFRNSAFCNICYYWCYNYGAVENKYRKCKYKS